ncbi:MAG TPA: ferrous iron transport protein B [Planctomycetota bacterium]|nr:ferrous iron transport protein B [Planctomycetota bacterium]
MSAPAVAEAPRIAAAVVAVVGNPNTGKSTLFNALTRSTQLVGNYPGVTVERRRGSCCFDGLDVTFVDLPGTYSLAATSRDEQVVVDVLSGRIPGEPRPQAVLCVADASHLRRNLYLASQVAETGLPVVVALNMADEAEAKGVKIDVARLSERLGVPVVPTVATRGEGLDALRRAIAQVLREPSRFAPVPWPPSVRDALDALTKPPLSSVNGTTPAEAARILFDAEAPGAPEAREHGRAAMKAAGLDPLSAESTLRYAHLEERLRGVVTAGDPAKRASGYALDRLLTHRVWGLLIFAGLMFGMFSSIYWAAAPLMDAIDLFFGWLAGRAGDALSSRPMLQSLVADGMIAGVGGVVIFLPQILILFLFIAVLEDSGYMSRAAFLMDRVFGWTGLNGKSFVPMLSSFACAIPGLMATRTIDDPKARLSTILVAPLMSCSARLPVYTLMIAAFIQPRHGALVAGAVQFAMYALGVVLALVIAFFINRFLLKLRSIPFVLEMPPYRVPTAKTVFRRMYFSGREFVVRAGTVIFAFSIVIWALTYFPRPEAVATSVQASLPGASEEEVERAVSSAYLEQSFLGRFGKAVQPAFAPAGFDWKVTVAVLAAFPAREVVVSTLKIIYAVEEGDDEEASDALLREKLAGAAGPDGRPVFTTAVAVAVMVFFALCLQCGSTVAVMAREASWRWAGFAFAYMTALAWLGAVVAYQVGTAWRG